MISSSVVAATIIFSLSATTAAAQGPTACSATAATICSLRTKDPTAWGGGPDSDWLRAGRGPDRLSGGPGGDDLVGERGEDLMRVRAGDDLFTARDGFADVWRETAGSIQPISMLGLT